MNQNSPPFKQTKKLDILCPHFKICSGCKIEKDVAYPPIYLEAQAFFNEHQIENFPMHYEEIRGWRGRAKLAIRGTIQNPLIGLFKEGSHEVIDIPSCTVHHPAINRGMELLRQAIKENHWEPYQEEGHKGILRYVQFVLERSSGKLQMTLVINDENQPYAIENWKKNLKKLWEVQSDFWHSFWVNINNQKTNTIFGKEWHHIFGESYLWENFLGREVCFQPSSFAQANLSAFGLLLKDLKERVRPDSSLTEYYSGVGVIGLSLLDKCKQVWCCEQNPFVRECFEQSKNKLNLLESQKIDLVIGDAGKQLDLLEEAEIIIVDPPRKGLDSRLLQSLVNIQNKKNLYYISCGWQGFKRDCQALIEGGWKLVKSDAYLFFPGSDHIELLVEFAKI